MDQKSIIVSRFVYIIIFNFSHIKLIYKFNLNIIIIIINNK